MTAGAPLGPVLLAHSYYMRLDPKQVRKMKPYPPLATLLGAAVLRRTGEDVRLFDAMLADGVASFARAMDRHRPAVVAIVEDNFNFLTKMCTVRMRQACLEMIGMAAARDCRVAVCGSDAADHPVLYLRGGADAVLLGEPEATLVELVRVWREGSGRTPAEVRGLVLPGDDLASGEVRHTGVRPASRNLDALPLPAWDLVDVEAYRSAWRDAHGYLSWNVVASRGCPYGCNWCAKPLFGRRYEQRSPGQVAAELRRLKDEVRPDSVWFADDIFGLTGRWIEEFADEVRRRQALIPFTMQSRASLMTPAVVDALARAGAREVWMGVESGAQEILDAMDKGTRVEEIQSATRLLKDAGIRACWFIQLGYPGEGWPEILATRNLIREERPDEIGVSVAYPLPGTEFHRRVRDQIGRKKNWVDSDDLAMLFQGTYGTLFYRRVRTLLHREVEVRRTDRSTARARLESAWRRLESEERRHRSPDPFELEPGWTPA